MKPHKHAELIKAWADGARIEVYGKNAGWLEIIHDNPAWSIHKKYRIKPEEKKPVVRWIWAWHNLQSWTLTNFYTEKELIDLGYDVSGMICLEFTRTEFPE